MPLPGDPDAVLAASRDLASAAAELAHAHDAVVVRGDSITADWSGRAAPAALEQIEQDARTVALTAEAISRAAAPLERYADDLQQAQLDYARGEQMMLDGRAAFAAVGSGAAPAADAARDTASQAMSDATLLMEQAQERALEANEAAARTVQEAAALLGPPTPARPVATNEPSALAEFGNAAASLGNAALRNPLDGLAVLGGGALAAVGAAGAVGSLALDATGVGLPAGIPLGGASAAAVVGGVGVAGAGLIDIARHAATDDRVAPFGVKADSESDVVQRARAVGEPGRSKRVRVVPTAADVRAVYDELSEGGTPVEWPSYDGQAVRLEDGTEVGLRESSLSNDVTVDVVPTDGKQIRIHRRD